jgi:hypothetical protein
LKELSAQVGNCAIQLGVELGLSMVDIEESLFKYSKDMFSQTFDVLKKWKNLRKVKPTIRILMRAFQWFEIQQVLVVHVVLRSGYLFIYT